MRSEPRWVSVEQLIRINQRNVLATGEPHGVLSPGLLESAWAKPLNRWHYGEDDLLTLAVGLMAGVAQNHPFQQGNKRTAFEAGLLLLEANGYELSRAIATPALADEFVRVVEHTLSEEAFVERLRPYVAFND